MAPSISNSFYLAVDIAKRQANVPNCAGACLLTADIGTCSSINDGSCLCKSPAFINSAEACFNTACTTVPDLQGAYQYAWSYCAKFGYNLPTTSFTALPPSSATPTNVHSTSITSSVVQSSIPSATIIPTPPTLYQISYLRGVNIGMTTACSFLLALTIALGILACRSRIKRDNLETQNQSWNGAGSTMRMESTVASQSRNKFGFKRSNDTDDARGQLTFQTASATSTSNWGHDKSSREWDDKTQLTSHTFGNARPDISFGGLTSIDESEIRLGEYSVGSVGEVEDTVVVPGGVYPKRSEVAAAAA